MRENTNKNNIISRRFSSWYPMEEGYENIFWWMKELARILAEGGIIVWKKQSTVSASIRHNLSEFSMLCAMRFGLYTIDHFILESLSRLIGPMKAQQHSRNFTSDFYVFKKDKKLSEKTSILRALERCEKNVYEGKVWETK